MKTLLALFGAYVLLFSIVTLSGCKTKEQPHIRTIGSADFHGRPTAGGATTRDIQNMKLPGLSGGPRPHTPQPAKPAPNLKPGKGRPGMALRDQERSRRE